jgi:hypothetical protein
MPVLCDVQSPSVWPWPTNRTRPKRHGKSQQEKHAKQTGKKTANKEEKSKRGSASERKRIEEIPRPVWTRDWRDSDGDKLCTKCSICCAKRKGYLAQSSNCQTQKTVAAPAHTDEHQTGTSKIGT